MGTGLSPILALSTTLLIDFASTSEENRGLIIMFGKIGIRLSCFFAKTIRMRFLYSVMHSSTVISNRPSMMAMRLSRRVSEQVL
jgi:hypothetical protein